LRPHLTMPKEQCRVAILLVGRMSSLNLSLHTLAMRRYIVEPLRADVFAVSDNSTSAADLDRDWKTSADAPEDTWAHVLPRVLGRYLRTYATYGEPPEVLQQAAATSDGALRIESLRVPKHKLVRKRTWGMWLKLQDAWNLLQARELAVGQRYTVVVRLRSDATPLPTWSRSQLCAQTAADTQSIFALTDQVFCGSRAAMAVAARLHSAIFTHYMGTWNGMTAKPFSVVHAIATAQAQHPCAFSGQTYRFYNKLVHLQLYPLLGNATLEEAAAQATRERTPGGRGQGPAGDFDRGLTSHEVPGSDALAHTQQSLVDALTVLGELRAARKQSPLVDPRESQGPGGRGAPPLVDMYAWPDVSRMHERSATFGAEESFIAWLLFHNISVKELALVSGSRHYLFKGDLWDRPPSPGPESGGAARCAALANQSVKRSVLDALMAPSSSQAKSSQAK